MTSRPQEAKAIDRLRREGQQPDSSGCDTERPIENLIMIGASAGGHHACREVIKGLSECIPAAVIIMQHMAANSSSDWLVGWIAENSRLPTVLVQSGERIQSGTIYIVPPMKSVSLKGRVLDLLPSTSSCRCGINTLFESAAHEFGDRVIGVILSGLLNDGTVGLKAIHDGGGLTIVQNPTDAEYPDMPSSAMKDLPVTFSLRLRDIGPTLDLLARRKTELETGLAVSIRMLKERLALLVSLIAQSQKNSTTQQFLSAESTALEGDLLSIQELLDNVLRQLRSR